MTNCFYLAESENTGSCGEYKTAEQFASGEVAYLLGEAWGQTLGTDTYPVLGGEKIYFGYLSGAEDAVAVYTNDATATAAKPEHNFSYNNGENHTAVCSECNYDVNEAHSFDANTLVCVARLLPMRWLPSPSEAPRLIT